MHINDYDIGDRIMSISLHLQTKSGLFTPDLVI